MRTHCVVMSIRGDDDGEKKEGRDRQTGPLLQLTSEGLLAGLTWSVTPSKFRRWECDGEGRATTTPPASPILQMNIVLVKHWSTRK